MAEPNLKSVLYIVPAEHVQAVIEQSITPNPTASAGNFAVDTIVAALRTGRPIQAMTTLQDGSVLFALGTGR
jgi:hypothetical protein